MRSIQNAMDAPRENKMGVVPVGRLLLSMSVPMMISMLVQAFYNVVDSIFVSYISERALSAVSMAFPLQSFMIAMGAGTGVGVNALLSRSLGEKRQDVADRAANVSVFLAVCMTVLFALIGAFGSRAFFRAQTDIAEIIDYGTQYLTICLCFSFGIFGQFCFERLLQATGRTSIAMVTQLIGAVINIVMDPVLIFGLLGMPKMGVAGAAAATVLGQIVAAAAALVLNLRFNREIHLRLREMRWNRETVVKIYQVGIPSIIMQSISSVLVFFLNKILIGFTDTATAVFGAYFKLQSFVFMPVFGLNNGMVPIVAYNYGAGRIDRVKQTIRNSIFIAVGIMLLGLALAQLIPGPMLRLFNASEDMLAIGISALRILSSSFLFAGFCIITASVCQALGTPRYSLITSVCRQLVVLLPAAYLLSLSGNLTLVWFAFPIAEIASLTLSAVFLRRTLKKVDAEFAETAPRSPEERADAAGA